MDKPINEKKLLTILLSVAAVAILVVILTAIPWGGDKARFRDDFGLSSRDHVYKTITFKDLEKMIVEEKTFQLFLGSPTSEDAKQLVFEANDLAKDYGVEVIYYLNSDTLTTVQYDYLFAKFLGIMEFPTLGYFSSDDGEYMLFPASCWKNLENDYAGNWYNLINEYFAQCYN